jgi:hypothetical protein
MQCGARTHIQNVGLRTLVATDGSGGGDILQQERGVFPPGTDLEATIALYVMLGSIELSTEDIARVAATLAHGGVSPVSGERMFAAAHVRACLSLMASCGLYQYSGEWCFSVGLPAKSASNGLIMAVVPNVMVRMHASSVCSSHTRTHTYIHTHSLMCTDKDKDATRALRMVCACVRGVRTQGLCVHSPLVDNLNNSVRGVELFKQLVTCYSFHGYELGTSGAWARMRRRSFPAAASLSLPSNLLLLWTGRRQEGRAPASRAGVGPCAERAVPGGRYWRCD